MKKEKQDTQLSCSLTHSFLQFFPPFFVIRDLSRQVVCVCGVYGVN